MKTYIYIILIITGFSILSCEDTLEQRLSNSVEVEEAIVDLNTLNLATNGAYSLLANIGHYNRNFVLVPEILSDNSFIDAFDNTGRFLDFDNYIINSNNVRTKELYNNMSRLIATTSIVIEKANDLSFPESEQEDASQYIGEVYTLRALAFHNFQLLFAQPYNFTTDASHLGVPIPEFELLGDGATLQEPSRSTTAKVYEQIVNDLENAIGLMRETSDPARLDIHATKGLLARVYLHMQNWERARDFANDVIENSGNELLSRDEYIASWGLDSNKETLFTVANNLADNSGANSIGHFYLNFKDAFATDDFKDTLDDTDIRRDLYPRESGVNMVKKFPKGTQDDNIQVLRLSEIYLIKAEAHAQLNEVVQAQQTLDIIIQRALEVPTLPDMLPVTTETGQALLDKIILERRKELAFEGFRLFDLTRYDKTFTKFRQDDEPIIVVGTDKEDRQRTILPIPIDEINVNPNIADQQNPGY